MTDTLLQAARYIQMKIAEGHPQGIVALGHFVDLLLSMKKIAPGRPGLHELKFYSMEDGKATHRPEWEAKISGPALWPEILRRLEIIRKEYAAVGLSGEWKKARQDDGEEFSFIAYSYFPNPAAEAVIVSVIPVPSSPSSLEAESVAEVAKNSQWRLEFYFTEPAGPRVRRADLDFGPTHLKAINDRIADIQGPLPAPWLLETGEDGAPVWSILFDGADQKMEILVIEVPPATNPASEKIDNA